MFHRSATAVALLFSVFVVHAQETKPDPWEQEIAALVAKTDARNPAVGGVLFVGSSSIVLWKTDTAFPEFQPINHGFGGSQVADTVRNFDRLVARWMPATVVFYAGDNDLASGKTPDEVVGAVGELLTKLDAFDRAKPNGAPTRFVWLPVKPSRSRWKLFPAQSETNRRVAELLKNRPGAAVCDTVAPLLNSTGEPDDSLYQKDQLHLNEAGYVRWNGQLRATLTELDATENWPQFRGRGAEGISKAKGLPTTWSETENVKWKTPIHDKGWSCPVVWGDQVWLTTAKEDGKEMFALCLDRATGKVLHDLKLFSHENPKDYRQYNSYASPTPAIEAGRVYITFGSFGTCCLDTQTGEKLWERTDLPCEHWRGAGSSPILFEGLMILNYDGYDQQYVVALNKQTGETVWKTTRSVVYGTDDGDVMKAYCTPIVIEAAGKTQLINPTSKAALSYDPRTGKEWWRVTYSSFSATAVPMFGNGLVYINTGFGKADLMAVRPDGEGDVSNSHVAWVGKKQVPSKPSQLLVGDRIFMVHDEGIASCVDAKTGDDKWTKRLGGKFTASPLWADGKVYFFDEAGVCTVVEAADEFKQVSENKLPSGCRASPAVAGKSLFVRTAEALYCLEAK